MIVSTVLVRNIVTKCYIILIVNLFEQTAYLHTCVYSQHILIHIHTFTNTRRQALKRTHHEHIHTRIYAHAHDLISNTHVLTCTHKHTHKTHTQIHAYTYAHAHKRAYTHAHTTPPHTHTPYMPTNRPALNIYAPATTRTFITLASWLQRKSITNRLIAFNRVTCG